jgi:hypothetical protein
LASALFLVAAVAYPSGDPEFLQGLGKNDGREEERRQAKKNTSIVLVLGTGCSSSFDSYELERQCSKYYSQYARFQPWLVPEPPCHELPAIRPDREEREYRLGWHLNCDYRMAYTAIIRRAASHLTATGWHFEVVEYMSEARMLLTVSSLPTKKLFAPFPPTLSLLVLVSLRLRCGCGGMLDLPVEG